MNVKDPMDVSKEHLELMLTKVLTVTRNHEKDKVYKYFIQRFYRIPKYLRIPKNQLKSMMLLAIFGQKLAPLASLLELRHSSPSSY